jgi:hypothetical protein
MPSISAKKNVTANPSPNTKYNPKPAQPSHIGGTIRTDSAKPITIAVSHDGCLMGLIGFTFLTCLNEPYRF